MILINKQPHSQRSLAWLQVVSLLNELGSCDDGRRRTAILRDIQDAVVSKDPGLLDSFFDELIQTQTDPEPQLRVQLVTLLEGAWYVHVSVSLLLLLLCCCCCAFFVQLVACFVGHCVQTRLNDDGGKTFCSYEHTSHRAQIRARIFPRGLSLQDFGIIPRSKPTLEFLIADESPAVVKRIVRCCGNITRSCFAQVAPHAIGRTNTQQVSCMTHITKQTK